MKKKNFFNLLMIVLFIVLPMGATFAEDVKFPCLQTDGTPGLRGLEKFDCKLAQGIANDPNIKADHEKKVIDKLADQLATQAEQTIEEMALLDQYFSENEGSLLMSDEVKNQCQLQLMANPKCVSSSKKQNYDQRMKILISKFASQKGQSLLELWSDKFRAVREPIESQENRCPLSSSSGIFLFHAQLTENDVKVFIKDLKGDKSKTHKSDSSNLSGEGIYSKYPLLKLLKTSESLGPEGVAFKIKFENYIKNYPGNGSYKGYLKEFFKSSENKDPLAKAVAHQCGQITRNMEKFLCEDLKSLAIPTEKASTVFFPSEEESTDLQISKGLSCFSGQQAAEEGGEKKIVSDSAGAWSESFTKDIRVEENKFAASRVMNQFCSLYNCKDKLSLKLESCQKGGPVSSQDLYSNFCKDDKIECTVTIQKTIELLGSLEKQKIKQQTFERVLAGKATEEEMKSVDKTPARSAFFDNFVRRDNDLTSNAFASEKKLNLASEDKKNENLSIQQKKAELSPQLISGKPDAHKSDRSGRAEPVVEQSNSMQQRLNTFLANNQQQDNEHARRALINEQIKNSSKGSTSFSKKMDSINPEGDRFSEMKRLRAELADVINEFKGSDEEKLEVFSEYNRSVLSPKEPSKMNGESSKKISLAERERLDQYRESLNSWENRLRNWQGQLSERDTRGLASSSVGSPPAQDFRDERSRFGQEGPSSNGENTAGLKLAKSAASASHALSGSKGDASNDRSMISEGGETDLGIVNSEKLATLKKDALKNLGIVIDGTLIIKVRHRERIYAIPVKTFSHKGKEMYVPLLDDKNLELSKIVFDSPLFSDYREYQRDLESRG